MDDGQRDRTRTRKLNVQIQIKEIFYPSLPTERPLSDFVVSLLNKTVSEDSEKQWWKLSIRRSSARSHHTSGAGCRARYTSNRAATDALGGRFLNGPIKTNGTSPFSTFVLEPFAGSLVREERM
eukprot:TRINITY_DN2989_c1_g1_i2.p2 TRINITY_DN2989_c1_g1~~TRINITY_DN2989_c1_g1_i2.p2  ORF type:complete len:124 (+),score=2.01 TRINITY_DN2989_c1_g1_i2:349-720(+)